MVGFHVWQSAEQDSYGGYRHSIAGQFFGNSSTPESVEYQPDGIFPNGSAVFPIDVWNGRYLRNCRRTVLSKFLHDADDIDVAWRVGLANFMMIL